MDCCETIIKLIADGEKGNKEANRIEVQKIWSNLKSLITFDAQPKIALIIILPTVKFSTGAFPNKILFCFLNNSQHVHDFAKYY